MRLKAKDGTHVFERYITIQCTVQNRRLVLGVLDMPSLENTADFVRKIIGAARDAGACIGMVMLDREFFAAGVMGTLGDMGIKYLVPCRNTDLAVDAIAESAAGKRGRVSEFTITRGDGMEVPYTLFITERKKKKKGKDDGELPPHERYIGFATNAPDVDPDLYENRQQDLRDMMLLLIVFGYKEPPEPPPPPLLPESLLGILMYSICFF